MKTIILILFLFFTNLYASKFYYEYDKKVEIEENTTKKRSASDVSEYQTKDGKTVKFKNEIIVQCKKNIHCEDRFSSLGIETFDKLSKSFFLIYLQKGQDIFDLSQKLYEDSSIKAAHPNFIKERISR